VHSSSFYVCGYDLPTGKEQWRLQTPCGQVVSSPVTWKDLVIAPGGGQNRLLTALRLEGEANSLDVRPRWRDKGPLPEIASPVIYRDYLYTVSPNGVASCRAPASNEVLWQERISGPCDASITAADGKIYFCDVNGVTTVVLAGPTWTVLTRNS